MSRISSSKASISREILANGDLPCPPSSSLLAASRNTGIADVDPLELLAASSACFCSSIEFGGDGGKLANT